MACNSKTRGFTIVELTVALAFMSILLIAILTLTITAGNMYVKGSTIKSMNQSWRDIEDTLRRDMAAASTDAIVGPLEARPDAAAPTRVSGRMCLGSVSYVWNTADLLNTGPDSDRIVLSDRKPARFARVIDTGKTVCQASASGAYPMNLSLQSSELLGAGTREIAFYTLMFSVIDKSADGKQGLYSLKATLGTSARDTTQLDTVNGSVQCKPNDSATSDFNYCSVSDIDMIIRVGGKE